MSEHDYAIETLESIKYDLQKELAKRTSWEIVNLREKQIAQLESAIKKLKGGEE